MGIKRIRIPDNHRSQFLTWKKKRTKISVRMWGGQFSGVGHCTPCPPLSCPWRWLTLHFCPTRASARRRSRLQLLLSTFLAPIYPSHSARSLSQDSLALNACALLGTPIIIITDTVYRTICCTLTLTLFLVLLQLVTYTLYCFILPKFLGGNFGSLDSFLPFHIHVCGQKYLQRSLTRDDYHGRFGQVETHMALHLL